MIVTFRRGSVLAVVLAITAVGFGLGEDHSVAQQSRPDAAPLSEGISGAVVNVPYGFMTETVCVIARAVDNPGAMAAWDNVYDGVPTIVQEENSVPTATFALYLGAGSYDLLATNSSSSCPFRSAPSMARYCPLTGSVSGVLVTANAVTTGIAIPMSTTCGAVAGRVRMPPGYSPSDVCLNISAGNERVGIGMIPDTQGRFFQSALPDGDYSLGVIVDTPKCQGFGGQGTKLARPANVPFTVRNGGTTTVRDIVIREESEPGDAASTSASAAPLKVRAPVLSVLAIAQEIVAPAPGVVTQVGTFTAAARAGKPAKACSGKARVRGAGTVTITCRLTAAARAARKDGAIRVTLVTTLVAKAKTYRAQRTVVMPKTR